MQISITENGLGLNCWKVKKDIHSFNELKEIVTNYSYSSAIFTGNRKFDNITSFNNVLIYDIDNDVDTPNISILEANTLLSEIGIYYLIIGTKSHQILKNDRVVDRFRVIIPTQTDYLKNNIDKKLYRAMQEIITKLLKINEFVDKKALTDPSRYYAKSPINSICFTGAGNTKRVMNLKKIEKEVILKSNINANTNINANSNNGNYLTRVDTNKIMNLNILDLVKNFEKVEEIVDGSYIYLKNDDVKYSYMIDDNVVFDFKSGKTYNSITYLEKQFNTINLSIIAKKLKDRLSIDFEFIDLNSLKSATNKALLTAKNDIEFADLVKNEFDNIKFCRLCKNSIKIFDLEIDLKDLQIEKIDMINCFRNNRAKNNDEIQSFSI